MHKKNGFKNAKTIGTAFVINKKRTLVKKGHSFKATGVFQQKYEIQIHIHWKPGLDWTGLVFLPQAGLILNQRKSMIEVRTEIV